MRSKLSSNVNRSGGTRRVLAYWRTHPAESFDLNMRASIDDWLRSLSATSPQWRAAIGGDAASAIGMALRLWPLRGICPLADMVMTILLAAAFDNAAAANVLSVTLRNIAIGHRKRMMLSKSWSAHQGVLARRTLGGARHVKFRKMSRSVT